jgi:hypothetical protein
VRWLRERRTRLPPLLLALLPPLAYAPAWAAGRLLAPGDGAALHYPLRAAVWHAYRQGEMPFWNPAIFLGTPLLASYRPGALHPLMVALSPLPDALAFQVLVLVSLALAGPLLYAYVRRLGAETSGAYVAGLCYALGPYLVGHLDDTATVVAAPLLPLLLLTAERWIGSGRGRYAVEVVGSLALLLLAGSPEAARAGAALLGGRLLVAHLFPGRAPRPSLPRAALITASALLLAAPQLVPALLAAGEAGRPVTGLANSGVGVLPGLAGVILRYASHSPAPALALAAVPLLLTQLPVRVLAAALAISLALQWGRGPLSAPGALALVFDLALAVLAGLCLSTLWRQRRRPRGRRLRALFLVACLVSAAALSVAAAALGPLPETLAGAVGTLALALILYFANAAATDPLRARLWLLPLSVSFLLQPHGRRVWAAAPLAVELREGSATRQAVARAMGPRVAEPALALVREWPGAEAGDLAYGNLAVLAGRRSANGYDPMVPLRNRVALGSMNVAGVLPEGYFHSDPGRLELLGVRWVQVPAAGLRRRVQEPELPLHLAVAGAHFFPFPMTAAARVRIVSSLVDAAAVPQGSVVATVHVRLASGRGEFSYPLRAGIETAEWAWDRPDVRGTVKHQRPQPAESWPVAGEGFAGHHYAAELGLPGSYFVDGVRLEPAPQPFRLQVMRLALVEAGTGRALPLAAPGLYVSDTERFREVAATPTLRLYEVRRAAGPARVAGRLHLLGDERALLEALAMPSRGGVDPARDALALAREAAGVTLPPGSRPGRAEVHRLAPGRLEVRAEGPGLLVLAEGWDRGWRARLDGAEARLLRVNHAELGLVLPAGHHRVALRYRARGFEAGLLLFAAGVLGTVGLGARGRSRARPS